MELGVIILSFFSFIGASTIISGLVLKRIDKLEKILERRENDRVEENIVRGEVIHTSAKLSEANTVALRVTVGEDVCAAELNEHRIAMDNLNHFLRKKSAEYLHAN